MAFDPRKLTVKASEAIQRAQEIAEKRNHKFLRPLHLLKSLLDEEGGLMTSIGNMKEETKGCVAVR